MGGEMSFNISEIQDVETSKPPKASPPPKVAKKTKNNDPQTISKARSLAIKAYQHASDNPFNSNARAEVLAILNEARSIDPNEAEIFLAETIMILQDGYIHGPWYKAWAYNDGVVDTAIYKVNIAISSDPTYYKPYAILAWLYIVKSNFSEAEELLDKSNSLETDNYYYWLYRGTLSQEKKEYDDAKTYYDIAEGYATQRGMRALIRDRKKDLAKVTGDFAEAEQYYLDDIARNPQSAYSYGNYAGFLLCTGRFDESIEYYEKAISIKPYPKVLFGLEIAKMGVNEAAKCKNNQVQI
jgi:tetratricopeptide (TPR) repeat protein